MKEWLKGCQAGTELVLEFLSEIKGLDFKDEFEAWSKADEYIKLNGEVVKKYE